MLKDIIIINKASHVLRKKEQFVCRVCDKRYLATLPLVIDHSIAPRNGNLYSWTRGGGQWFYEELNTECFLNNLHPNDLGHGKYINKILSKYPICPDCIEAYRVCPV